MPATDAPDIGGQHRRGDFAARIAAGQDHDALDIVAELADIAGPVVGLQDGNRILGKFAQRLAGDSEIEFGRNSRSAPECLRAVR